MRLLSSAAIGLLASFVGLTYAKTWGFKDATVSVQSRAASGDSRQEIFTTSSAVSRPVTLGSLDSLRVALTATEDNKGTRPNQVFLTLREPTSGLEDAFPLKVKESGTGTVELTQKDLPNQLLAASAPLKASIIIGSFGNSKPLNTYVFDLNVKRDQSSPVRSEDQSVRYGKLEEIHHIFRPDPKSPPMAITLLFTAIAIATLPALLGVWLSLGANVHHLPEAFRNAPLSHAAFLGSILALEGIFFLYYTTWNLFQMLPAAGVAGIVAFLSGSRALSEVQGRRIAGKR